MIDPILVFVDVEPGSVTAHKMAMRLRSTVCRSPDNVPIMTKVIPMLLLSINYIVAIDGFHFSLFNGQIKK